jgi:hypothetical protein
MLPVAAALVDKLYAPADVHAPPDVWRHPVQPDVLPRGAVDGHWKHGSTEAIRRHGSPCGSSPSLQSFAHQGGLAMTQGRSPASPCATYPNVEKPLVTSTSHMLSRYISLSVINSSLSEDVLSTVVGAASARDAWTTLEKSYASRSKARIMQIRMQLSTIQKKDLCIAEYFRKVKRLADTLAAIGKRLKDKNLSRTCCTDSAPAMIHPSPASPCQVKAWLCLLPESPLNNGTEDLDILLHQSFLEFCKRII